MNKVNCQQKMVAEYFGFPLGEKCGRCGNCLRPVISVAIDNTLHAKQLVTCFQNMQALKEKVGVDELAGTYIGSKGVLVKNQKFDQVPAYGNGKGHFKSVTAEIYLQWTNNFTLHVGIHFYSLAFITK